LAIVWDKNKEGYRVGGHDFDRSDFQGNLPEEAIEKKEQARLNSLLAKNKNSREVFIHIHAKNNNKGVSILTKPLNVGQIRSKWWEAPINI
jgi:cobyrinic acid a,c-diamide synthase